MKEGNLTGAFPFFLHTLPPPPSRSSRLLLPPQLQFSSGELCSLRLITAGPTITIQGAMTFATSRVLSALPLQPHDEHCVPCSPRRVGEERPNHQPCRVPPLKAARWERLRLDNVLLRLPHAPTLADSCLLPAFSPSTASTLNEARDRRQVSLTCWLCVHAHARGFNPSV